jgi:hypothetical protein
MTRIHPTTRKIHLPEPQFSSRPQHKFLGEKPLHPDCPPQTQGLQLVEFADGVDEFIVLEGAEFGASPGIRFGDV